MNLESRKINLINWISSIQEEDVLARMEQIQKESKDWWDSLNNEDKKAICKGLNQLDKDEFFTRSQVREKIKLKFNI
jgi:plasmid stabilization system protein ParE